MPCETGQFHRGIARLLNERSLRLVRCVPPRMKAGGDRGTRWCSPLPGKTSSQHETILIVFLVFLVFVFVGKLFLEEYENIIALLFHFVQ